MNSANGPGRQRLLLVAAGAVGLLLLAVLPFALRDVVARVVVEPAARFWWAARQIFRMVPQTDLWVGLILLAALNFALIFARRARLPGLNRPPVIERGRIAAWRDQLAVGRQARRLLVRPLLNLLVQTVAQVREQPESAVRDDLYSGRLDLPADVQRFLAARPGSESRKLPPVRLAEPHPDQDDLFADLAPEPQPMAVPGNPGRPTPAAQPLLTARLPAEVEGVIVYMEQLLGEPDR